MKKRLGACNPHFASRTLQAEGYNLGLLLPCNGIIQ
ncbi:MAG: DUF302 domain-containing protein [Anaerolineales bacterium]|nr:DUF302 domain-containing protein [Anaerolineales bacterium]